MIFLSNIYRYFFRNFLVFVGFLATLSILLGHMLQTHFLSDATGKQSLVFNIPLIILNISNSILFNKFTLYNFRWRQRHENEKWLVKNHHSASLQETTTNHRWDVTFLPILEAEYITQRKGTAKNWPLLGTFVNMSGNLFLGSTQFTWENMIRWHDRQVPSKRETTSSQWPTLVAVELRRGDISIMDKDNISLPKRLIL